MAAIEHAWTGCLTAQQTFNTETYTNLAGTGYTALTSSNFTVGKKYLLYACAAIGHIGVGAAETAHVRLVHGSTEFDHSDMVLEPNRGGSKYLHHYRYFTVWTAVASEGVTLQCRTGIDPDDTYIDRAFVFAMNLSDDLVEGTDWEWSESHTTTTVPKEAPATHSSITVDAASPNNGNWLVLSQASFRMGTESTDSWEMIQKPTGDVTSTIMMRREPERADNRMLMHRSRGYALTSNGNTFATQINFDGSPAGDPGTCEMSGTFALNMSKFKASAIAETLGTFAWTGGITTPSYTTTAQSVSIDPTVTSDVLCNVECWGDPQSGSDHKAWYLRLEVDGNVRPSDETTDGYKYDVTQDSSDRWCSNMSWLETNMTSGSKTITLKGDQHAETVTQSDCGERTAWAFTMELAGGGGQTEAAELASVIVKARDITAAAGGVTQSASLASVIANAHDVTAAAGAVSQAADLANVIARALDVTAAPGTATGNASLASVVANAHDVTATAGALTEAAELASVLVRAYDVVASESIAAELASVAVRALDVTATAGAVSIGSDLASVLARAYDVIATEEGVVAAELASVAVRAFDVTAAAGALSEAAELASVLVRAYDVDADVVILAEKASVAVKAFDVTAVPGTATIAAELASVIARAYDVVGSTVPLKKIYLRNRVEIIQRVEDTVKVVQRLTRRTKLK